MCSGREMREAGMVKSEAALIVVSWAFSPMSKVNRVLNSVSLEPRSATFELEMGLSATMMVSVTGTSRAVQESLVRSIKMNAHRVFFE
jgi:hypothetical protein